MPKYTVSIVGIAQVIAQVQVEAEDRASAEAKGEDPDVIVRAEFRFDHLLEIIDVYVPFFVGPDGGV